MLNEITESLTKFEISQFIHQGFVKIPNAFSAEVALECRTILWEASNCSPNNPATWTHPVIRIAELGHDAFKKAANTTLLHTAFNQLAGEGNWMPRTTMGSFPIRFPSKEAPSDTGWHVDASFPGLDSNNFLEWRINVYSKGRALLMLFLFSDVTSSDAPTRIRVGSHFDVAKILAPAGAEGLSFGELAKRLDISKAREEITATGEAGTVFLCHPFIVHAAQAHYGKAPKFMAQPPLLMQKDFSLKRPDNNYCPVERSILMALE